MRERGKRERGKGKGEEIEESEREACELERTRFAAPSCRARRLDADCAGLDNCRPPKLPLYLEPPNLRASRTYTPL